MPFLTRKHLKCITKATSVVYGPLKVVHRHIFHIEHNFFPQILYYGTRSIAPMEENVIIIKGQCRSQGWILHEGEVEVLHYISRCL